MTSITILSLPFDILHHVIPIFLDRPTIAILHMVCRFFRRCFPKETSEIAFDFVHDGLDICHQAAKLGYLGILKLGIGLYTGDVAYLFNPDYRDSIFRLAAKGGMATLRWVHSRMPPGYVSDAYIDVSEVAAKRGNLEMLEWLVSSGYPVDATTCAAAARGGHLETLQWLRARNPPCEWDSSVYTAAAREGHIHILSWLKDVDVDLISVTGVCTSAASRGQIGVLQWVRSLRGQFRQGPKICSVAVRAGHLDTLRWLRAQDPPCPWSETSTEAAASRGNLDIMKWLRSQSPPCPWNIQKCTTACLETNSSRAIPMLNWLRSQGLILGQLHQAVGYIDRGDRMPDVEDLDPVIAEWVRGQM